MSVSKSSLRAFGLISFVSLAMGGSPLFASYTVTESTGSGSGSLPYAINAINNSTATNPILLETSVSGDSVISVTSDIQIESSSSGTARTIEGFDIAIDLPASETLSFTTTSDISFTSNDSSTSTIYTSCSSSSNCESVTISVPSIDGYFNFSADTSINETPSNLSGLSIFEGTVTLNVGLDSKTQIDLFGGTCELGSGLTETVETFYLNANSAFMGISAGSSSTLTLPFFGVISQSGTPSEVTLSLTGNVIIPTFNFNNINQDYSLTIDGVLSGSSGLTLSYTGTGTIAYPVNMFLASANTYTGATNLSASFGVLNVGINKNASIGTLSDNITVGQNCNLQVNGTVSANQVLVDSGATTVWDSGAVLDANIFTNYGDFYWYESATSTIGLFQNGEVIVLNKATPSPNGTMNLKSGSVLTVEFFKNYGTVSGCGTIDITNTFTNYATMATGCSTSDLTIDGNADFASGSILSPYLDPDGVSGLVVTGDLTLDPGVSLQFRPESGCYTNGDLREFVTVGGTLTGTFSSIDMGTILLTPTISYGSDSITLTIERTKLADLGFEGNIQQVASVADSLIDSGHSLCGVIGEFILSTQGELGAALDQLQPSLFKGLTISQENNAVKVRESLDYRMGLELDSTHCHLIASKEGKEKQTSCSKEKRPLQIWVNGMGDALHQSKTNSKVNSYAGYHESMAGVVLGLDYRFADCLYAGVLGAYTNSDIKWNDSAGKGTIESAYTGLYFSALGKMFYGNVSVVGAWNHYDAHRNIDLPSSSLTAKNKHGGAQLLSHADTGINLGWGGFTVRPFDSFDYITQTENAYTETGAGDLDLSIKKSNAIMLRNELGLNFAHCLCFSGVKLIISPKISWVREVRVKGDKSTAEFVNTDESFTVVGYFPNRSLVSPGVSVSATTWKERLTAELYYNGEFNGSYSDHSYGGQLRVGF